MQRSIDVIGAGILGLWQALMLARAGHRVRLIEASAKPFDTAQSRFAGAMLAPGCEAVDCEPSVSRLGGEALALWRAEYPSLVNAGSLVVAGARDASELRRFARMVSGFGGAFDSLDAERLAALEPELAGRFDHALHFPDEAHMTTPDALAFLLEACRTAGVAVHFATPWREGEGNADLIIDCRGLGARHLLAKLRGVRGERVLIKAPEIALRRPVRLLHPRHPLYVVPWTESRYLVGATVIESEDDGPVTVRSALEMLGLAYALHPGFAEAQIIDFGAGVRPSLPDNLPRVLVEGRHIHVNGAFRHGFLLAPVLAVAVADYLATGRRSGELMSIA